MGPAFSHRLAPRALTWIGQTAVWKIDEHNGSMQAVPARMNEVRSGGDSGRISAGRNSERSATPLCSLGQIVIPAAADLPPALADKRALPDDPVAYRCIGSHCEAPVTGPARLDTNSDSPPST